MQPTQPPGRDAAIELLLQHGVTEPPARALLAPGEQLRLPTVRHGAEFAALVDTTTGAQIAGLVRGGAADVDVAAQLSVMQIGRTYASVHTRPSSSSFSE